jgi:glucan phosphoethanolaminetransferase (alkaline phosphatase superfamily)
MKRAVILESGARVLLWAVTALTSIHCLLCTNAFTWIEFIKVRLYPPWYAAFLGWHWAAIAFVAVLAGATLRGRQRWIWAAIAVVSCAGAWRPGLPSLTLGRAAFVLSWLAWIPYVAWEFMAAGQKPAVDWELMSDPDERLPQAGLAAGLIVGLSYAANASLAGRSIGACLWSLLVHGALGCGLGLLLESTRDLSSSFKKPRLAQILMIYLLLALAAAIPIYLIALLSLSFPGVQALAYSLFLACLAAWGLARQSALTQPASPAPTVSAFVAAPGKMLGLMPGSLWGRLIATAVVILWPKIVSTALGGVDWNFMIAMLGSIAAWAMSLLLCYGWLSRRPRPHGINAWWPTPTAALALCLGIPTLLNRAGPALRFSGWDIAKPLEALSEVDPSLRAMRRLATATQPVPDIFSYLQRSTNIPREIPVAPMDIILSRTPPQPGLDKPHIFVIVVDSLRQDYVGAYNPAVRFTPEIDAFAKDSWVFRDAFTAYGATGLSEPSIWTGARMVHKQYVLPFSPMNSLEKLVVSEGYRRYISMDVILSAILDPKTPDEPLDEKTSASPRLCGTIDELLSKIDSRPAGKPIFFYTQPQDIHIATIQQEGATPIGPGAFDGFYAPYASRLARLDQCFGNFVAQLKKRNIYDNSIIVFAADHGDSLGEDGRWGHAYTLFPEILRVPLIMHVPERLKQGKVWDLDAPAFLIDIAPTLYSLLGRPPEFRSGIYGRSLVDLSAQALAANVPKTSLEVSSYGPVYGLIKDGGRTLYIADGVNYQTYLFDLRADPQGRRNLSDAAAQADNNAALRAAVEEINAFYGFRP